MRVRIIASIVALLIGSFAVAQTGSEIWFVNFSGEDCVVKLVGPTERYVDVRDGGTAAVPIRDGRYHIITRYGDRPSTYRYSRGEKFTVAGQRVSITLHKVVNGNYRAKPASERDFE